MAHYDKGKGGFPRRKREHRQYNAINGNGWAKRHPRHNASAPASKAGAGKSVGHHHGGGGKKKS